jgi:hypothetical protein
VRYEYVLYLAGAFLIGAAFTSNIELAVAKVSSVIHHHDAGAQLSPQALRATIHCDHINRIFN